MRTLELDNIARERRALLYHSAAASVSNAVCSLDDETTSNQYIQGCLRNAASDLCELLADGIAGVPRSAVVIRGPSADILAVCNSCATIGRAELTEMAKQLEERLKKIGATVNVEEDTKLFSSNMHAYVGCCG